MKFAFYSSVICLTIALPAQAEVISISGSVKDKVSLAPIDSARIDIVNSSNPAERYSVITNSAGMWSYMFNISGVDEQSGVPDKFAIEQNYPNPFNPSTRINFSTRTPGDIRIAVYNILGQLIDAKTFSVPEGEHTVDWTSKGAAGVLIYTAEFDGKRITRKMVQLDGGGNGGLGDAVTFGRHSSLPSRSKGVAATYNIIASRLIFMPDTISMVLSNNAIIDFLLETVHNRAFVIDLHNDVMEKLVLGGYQFGTGDTRLQSDLPRFREGGYDAQMFALWADPADSVKHPYYAYTLEMADSFNSQIRQNPSRFAQARTYDEIMQLNGSGKLAGVLAVEGGYAIENNLDKLKAFYALGARYMTITWNNSTSWAISAEDPRSATVGLSDFGRQVVRTMDSLGMIIDVSHTGIQTIWDILATTKNPIIASHSGVRALRNHYRNLTDAQIDSIAHRGGVIGVVFYTSFLSGARTVTIDTVIKHIDYIKNRVGIDYVALGSDFDGGITAPVGLEDVSKIPNLTAALLRRGYSISDVRKILGENYLRVFRQVCK